ncbi:hypothetical protein DFH29DRAFT_881790 [Suillus ampliporus]|nr:hypothetical protein DFH29DRAFT_881790 [Suillus ampliporus]
MAILISECTANASRTLPRTASPQWISANGGVHQLDCFNWSWDAYLRTPSLFERKVVLPDSSESRSRGLDSLKWQGAGDSDTDDPNRVLRYLPSSRMQTEVFPAHQLPTRSYQLRTEELIAGSASFFATVPKIAGLRIVYPRARAGSRLQIQSGQEGVESPAEAKCWLNVIQHVREVPPTLCISSKNLVSLLISPPRQNNTVIDLVLVIRLLKYWVCRETLVRIVHRGNVISLLSRVGNYARLVSHQGTVLDDFLSVSVLD